MNTQQKLGNLIPGRAAQTAPRTANTSSTRLFGLRRVMQSLAYILAFVLPPLLIGAAVGAVRFMNFKVSQPPAYSEALPPVKAHDPGKRTAVVLAGNLSTENTDFLASFEVLAASGVFNVYVVAPERKVSALTSMPALSESIDIVPDYSFAEYEKVIGHDPDLIVIPFIPNLDTPEDRPIVDWIRHHAGPQTTLLSICAGALTLAETGLLDGQTATIHHNAYPVAKNKYTAINWVQGVRYVDNGQIITSGGITAGIDATLYTLAKLAGRKVALDSAHKLNYPHTRFLENEQYDVPPANMGVTMTNLAWVWAKERIGVYVYEGMDELAVSSLVDTYPFTGVVRTLSVGAERKPIRTRHGLTVIPRWTFATAPSLSRLLIPGGELAENDAEAVEQWAQQQRLTAEYAHGPNAAQPVPEGQFVFDQILPDVARRYSRPIAEVVVNGLEYPFPYSGLAGSTWPYYNLVTPALLGLAGLALMIGLRRRRTMQA